MIECLEWEMEHSMVTTWDIWYMSDGSFMVRHGRKYGNGLYSRIFKYGMDLVFKENLDNYKFPKKIKNTIVNHSVK